MVAGTVALWIVALALFGWLGDGCVRRRAEQRLATSMQATVTIGTLDLAPVSGGLALRDLRLERRERGSFRLAVDEVDVDLRPLGLALVQDDLGDVRVRGVDIELSLLGALDQRSRSEPGEPVTFERLELRDAHVAIVATSLAPGVGRIDLTIERAVAGRTTMRTPLSWLFALRELIARLDLPGGLTARVSYADGTLRLAGGALGDTPLEVPFAIPVLEPARELEQLAEIGRTLARELVVRSLERARKSLRILP